MLLLRRPNLGPELSRAATTHRNSMRPSPNHPHPSVWHTPPSPGRAEPRLAGATAAAVAATRGQLVLGALLGLAAVGAFGREVGDSAGQLPHCTAYGDTEHTLPTLEQVDDLFRRRALVHRGAVGEQSDLRQVRDAALTQVIHRDPNVLQRDAGVEESLDDLEDEDVLERVQTLAARACCAPDRRDDQRRPRPVVELAVGDPRDLACDGNPVADELVGDGIVGEQSGLGVEYLDRLDRRLGIDALIDIRVLRLIYHCLLPLARKTDPWIPSAYAWNSQRTPR
ncbi:hypothetical protein RHCRD62_20745 [Rhodococcus sp. RD6.2]|nr:hypothetical protein RHCRD62_20745 [Rhodococcus sp. RD6.2]